MRCNRLFKALTSFALCCACLGTANAQQMSNQLQILYTFPSGFGSPLNLVVYTGLCGIPPSTGSSGTCTPPNVLYGITQAGSGNAGEIFQFSAVVQNPVTPYTALYTFSQSSGGTTGYNPTGGVVLGSDQALYGTTGSGGANNLGTFFRYGLFDGTSLQAQYSFTSSAYSVPAPLIQARDGNFYGVTQYGGVFGDGTIFQITPSGSFAVIYNFMGQTDGLQPLGGLVQGTDGYLYGTTAGNGTVHGAIFKTSTSGSLTVLHTFTGGADGDSPRAALVEGSDGNFYGTTYNGGVGNQPAGTMFQITPTGTLTTKATFDLWYANTGGHPDAPLTLVANSTGGVVVTAATSTGSAPNDTYGGIFLAVPSDTGPSNGAPQWTASFTGQNPYPNSAMVFANQTGSYYGTGQNMVYIYGPGANLPTLPEWGIIVLGVMLALFTLYMLRNRNSARLQVS